MGSRGFSVYSGTMGFSPLLEECANKSSSKYVIFDQSVNSRRIWVPPHLIESMSVKETVALGLAAYENVKSSRAKALFPSLVDPGRRVNGVRNTVSVPDNVNSYQTEASEEIDALLSSEDEDEVTSRVTLADNEEFWGSSGASDEVDLSNKWKRPGIYDVIEGGADIGGFSLESSRHGSSYEDFHLTSNNCRDLQKW